MRVVLAVPQLFQPRDWDDAGPLGTVPGLAVVAAYARVRMVRRTALQRISELVRALGVALLAAAIALWARACIGRVPGHSRVSCRRRRIAKGKPAVTSGGG